MYLARGTRLRVVCRIHWVGLLLARSQGQRLPAIVTFLAQPWQARAGGPKSAWGALFLITRIANLRLASTI